MSRPSNITYQSVASFCLELVASGERPTVRKIYKHLGGGSFSTITDFYQQWQREQALVSKTKSDLSEPFRQAVLAEFARVTEEIQHRLEAQLRDEQAQLKESQELLAEYESRIEQLNEGLAAYKKDSEETQLRLEKELSAAQARTEEIARRETTLGAQLEAMRQQCHGSELRTATSEAKLAEIEKYCQRLESEIQTLKAELHLKNKI